LLTQTHLISSPIHPEMPHSNPFILQHFGFTLVLIKYRCLLRVGV
jgi:hypothetical protein